MYPDESAGSFVDELHFNANSKVALIAKLKQGRDVGMGWEKKRKKKKRKKKQVPASLNSFSLRQQAQWTGWFGVLDTQTPLRSQPGASEFIGLMMQSPISHSLLLSLSLSLTHTFTALFFLSLHLFPGPALPTHLFSWLDRLALFWDQQLRARGALWRGIAFNRDEVRFSSLSAPVLSHRVFSVVRGTLPRPHEADNFCSDWLYSPLFVSRGPPF